MSMLFRRLSVGLLCIALYSGAGWLPLAGTGSGGGGCTQATTFLARTSGVSGGDQTAMTTLICGLVTDGVITGTLATSSFCGSLLDAFYVLAITNSTTAGLDICGHVSSPNYTLTVNGSPTFTADAGYTGVDGSSTVYLDTGIMLNSTTNYVQNSAHMSCWDNLTSRGTGGGNCMGSYNVGVPTLSQIDPQYTDGNGYFRQNDGATLSGGGAVANAQGFFLGSRNSSSTIKGYRAISGTVTDLGITAGGSSSSPPTVSVSLLAINTDGARAGYNNQLMAATVGGSLTLTQVTSLYTRLRTYLTTVAGIVY